MNASPPQPGRPPGAGPGVVRIGVLYTTGRLGLFLVVAVAVNLLIGLNGPVLLLLALLVSSLLSYFLLAGLRRRLAAAFETRARVRSERAAELRRRLDEPDGPAQR